MEPRKTLVVKGGSRLYLRCAVAANPEPDWTWIKDGKVISSVGNVYEKDNVDNNDAGSYTCVAKNLKGEKNVTQDIVVLGKFTCEEQLNPHTIYFSYNVTGLLYFYCIFLFLFLFLIFFCLFLLISFLGLGVGVVGGRGGGGSDKCEPILKL